MSAATELPEPENKRGFPATTAFERYAVKTSEKANLHNRTWLTATSSARSVYLQEVTTNGMYPA